MSKAAWAELPTDLQTVVRCVLSRTLFDNQDLKLSSAWTLCEGLAAWGTAPLFRRGEELSAPFPDMRQGPWPTGARVMRERGVSRDQLAALWESRKQRWHEEATLSDDLLQALVPTDLWPVIAQVITEGPDDSVRRLAAALDRLETRTIRPTKARPNGGFLSATSISGRRDRVYRLFLNLVVLRSAGLESGYLNAWTHVPPRPAIAGEDAVVTDRSAPSRRLCRLVFATYRAHVLRRLGCHSIERLSDDMRRMSRSRIEGASVMRALRMLTILTIILITGTRRLAVVRLRRGDYHRRHMCWDGIARPAIAVRPGKGKPWDQEFFKPIPIPAGRIIEAWMLLVERLCDQPLTDEDPLIVADLVHPHVPLHPDGLTNMLSGYVAKGGERTRSNRAAFPRYIDSVESLGKGRGPWSARDCTGYSPHALRHAADQLVEHGAPRYLADLGEYRISGSIIVKAMCNHSMTEDPLQYKDFANTPGLERLCCMGAEIAWAVLTTDAGARMVMDRDRIESAMRKRAALESELERIRDRISTARIRVERIAHADPSCVTHEDWLRAHTLRSSIDLLWDERVEAQDALREVDREIESLQHDPARLVALPDDVEAGDLAVDLAALQMAIDGTSVIKGTRRRRRRRWLTPAEFADVAGVSTSEVKRWLAGNFSSRHRGPRPWPSDAIPVD